MTFDQALKEQVRLKAHLEKSFFGHSLRGAELLVWAQTFQDEETGEWDVMPCIGWRTLDHAWGNHVVVPDVPNDDKIKRSVLGILQAGVDRHLN